MQTELGSQSTNSSNDRCVSKQGGKINEKKTLTSKHKYFKDAQHSDRQCKEIINALVLEGKLTPR